MHNILMQDAISLALLYCNMSGYNNRIISMNKVEAYKLKIDDNLYNMGSEISMKHSIDYNNLIYFNACDENGNWYSILKPDIDIEKARKQYIYTMPYDIIKASQEDNALEVLGLQLIDGKIVRKEEQKVKLLNKEK